jgi:ubiquinone/menaquinone biosynthesis C-methylase UbiE
MSVITDLSIKEVYNKIAHQFNHTRISIWGIVKKFLDEIPSNSYVLEIGCGNGKNMLYRDDLNFEGIDISEKQFEICKRKGLNVHVSSMCNLPFEDNLFDYQICIATYHHLDNDDDRQKALKEMYRTIKIGGHILITVWSMRQEPESKFKFTSNNELVPWLSKDDGNTYLRYYHIYRENELEDEIKRLCPEFNIKSVEYELGNWAIILFK